MMIKFVLSVVFVGLVSCDPAPAANTENYKDQYCTDPRTMRKHAAYTEWADAYSCSRHRCQPGGRNLAIYTVGCKRVEAPESAIECEEVVEDTNMQFPYCCTRLRCLVVVRGEVWTRVLGQPWETLPAAPWSHMYKMKKPPPGDSTFLPKSPESGPIYELAEPERGGGGGGGGGGGEVEKVLRSGTTESADYNDVMPRTGAGNPGPGPPMGPDIVIALSTNADQKEETMSGERKHKRKKSALPSAPYYEEEKERDVDVQELEEIPISTERPIEQTSDEKAFINSLAKQKIFKPQNNVHHQSWTELPAAQWENDAEENNVRARDPIVTYSQPDFPQERSEKKEEKPSNLQALVDAIGTRMRDIENVVQRMSEKVQQVKPEDELNDIENNRQMEVQKKHRKGDSKEHNKMKKKDPDGENYKRFSPRNHGSKYLRTMEFSTEPPLFVEDSHLNGYYSDASNSVARRAGGPKEPAQSQPQSQSQYMAPVETRRKMTHSPETDDAEKKHKKHHKKKNRKHNHKKHHAKEEKKKRFNKLSQNSVEIDKITNSIEDSSGIY